jgi:hypothetical protein
MDGGGPIGIVGFLSFCGRLVRRRDDGDIVRGVEVGSPSDDNDPNSNEMKAVQGHYCCFVLFRAGLVLIMRLKGHRQKIADAY